MRDSQFADTLYYTAHGIMLALLAGLAVGGVLYMLCVWPSIPDWVGYHFDADGTFNLFGSKNIAFLHPIIAEVLVDALMLGLSWLCGKVRPMRGFSERLHRRTVRYAALLCDTIALAWAALFTHWIACVAQQNPLNTTFAKALIWLCIAAFAAFVLWLIVATVSARRRSHE